MKGSELRRLRTINGKTQDHVADRMGVKKAAISRIEGRDDVRDDTAARYIGAMLGFDVVQYFTKTVWKTVDGAPIFHATAMEMVTVKAEGDLDDGA